MSLVEGDGISGEQPTHKLHEFASSGTEEDVKMSRDERLGKTVCLCFHQQIRESLNKEFPVQIVSKDITSFNSTNNHVLQKSWYVDPSLARHMIEIFYSGFIFNNLTTSPCTSPDSNGMGVRIALEYSDGFMIKFIPAGKENFPQFSEPLVEEQHYLFVWL